MTNFFDGKPYNDVQALMTYISTRSPEDMLAELSASTIDPNDLPALADMVKMLMKDAGKAHARVLYAEGIRLLEANPERKASDVNLTSARRNLCVCYMPDDPEEAFNVLSDDLSIVAADPVLGFGVAVALAPRGHSQQIFKSGRFEHLRWRPPSDS